MLDISQYTGSRAKKSLTIFPFWHSEQNDNDMLSDNTETALNSGEKAKRPEDSLRRIVIIYDPATFNRKDFTTVDTTPKIKETGEIRQRLFEI